MSLVDRVIGLCCTAAVSFFIAILVCFAAFLILIDPPIFMRSVAPFFGISMGTDVFFGCLFLFTFCTLMGGYIYALWRVK